MIDHILAFAIPAAYSLLPVTMKDRRATALMVCIALQESRCTHRRQIGGPAKSLWMFERNGVAGIMGHPRTHEHLIAAMHALQYDATSHRCHQAIEHNDTLAAICARLLLWTVPEPLPPRTDPDTGWRQYVQGWRPGRPRPESWEMCWERAWLSVDGPAS